jgi:DNA repair exonuclease SbcCD ATPase subunit
MVKVNDGTSCDAFVKLTLKRKEKSFMKKTVAKKRKMGKRGRKPGAVALRVHGHGKRMTPVQKVRAAHKELKAKLAGLKAEFKEKLKEVTASAYEKAHAAIERAQEKRASAKQAVLAAAEAKFEKKYAKKLGKAAKKRGRRKGYGKATAVPVGVPGKKKGRRGRPPKAV